MQGKKVKDSSVINHTYKIFPNDLNSYGTVFGGLVMAICDRIALVVAERHSGRTCVTASVDAMHFVAPAGAGDILLVCASINRSWKSSMEIGIKVMAEHYETHELKHIVSAYFTFVAVDESKKPVIVAEVIAETPEEKRRFEQAEVRRKNRIEQAKNAKDKKTPL